MIAWHINPLYKTWKLLRLKIFPSAFLQSYLETMMAMAFILVAFSPHVLKEKMSTQSRALHLSSAIGIVSLKRIASLTCQGVMNTGAKFPSLSGSLLLSPCQATCQRLRQEREPETQQESVRAQVSSAEMKTLCAKCSNLGEPASSSEAEQWFPILKEWTVTKAVLSYTPLKKKKKIVIREVSWIALFRPATDAGIVTNSPGHFQVWILESHKQIQLPPASQTPICSPTFFP